jgi:hypothetical protein
MPVTRMIIAVAVLMASNVHAGPSIVVGKTISESDDVKILPSKDEVCPEDAICLQGWSRWTIKVSETLQGPAVKTGNVHVVHMQHTTHDPSTFKKLHFFTLEYIAEPAERSRLHADYKLMDLLEERQMLCAYSDPKQEGIQTEGVYVLQTDDYTEYCFTAADHRHSDK